VLARSGPIPNGPLIVRSSLDATTRALLSDAMLRIHEIDPAAAQVMLRQGHRFTMAANRSNPTLKSIATLAGVSYATVSRVINASGYVAPATAARVQAIIDELGYAPNGNARVLHGRQFPLIGMLARFGDGTVDESFTSRLAILRAGFEQERIPFVLCPIGASFADSSYGDMLRDGRLGALIVEPADVEDPEILALARTGRPLIVLGSSRAAQTGIVESSIDTVVATVVRIFRTP
jgi:DNA-binding LacI/PurR family transcriptional regulator